MRDLKGQIAELTALATEKVTTRSLTAADHERLIDEALAELHSTRRDGGQGVNEAGVARVYAQALFDAAGDAGAIGPVGRELGDFVAALAASAPLRGVLADPQVDTDAKTRVVAELTREAQPLVGSRFSCCCSAAASAPSRRSAPRVRRAGGRRGRPSSTWR